MNATTSEYLQPDPISTRKIHSLRLQFVIFSAGPNRTTGEVRYYPVRTIAEHRKPGASRRCGYTFDLTSGSDPEKGDANPNLVK